MENVERLSNRPEARAIGERKPLDQYPVFRTSNREEVRRAAETVFGATRIELSGQQAFEARAHFLQLQDIAFAYGSINTDIILDYPEVDYVGLQIALAGNARTTTGTSETELDAGRACIASPGRVSRMICQAGHERLTLRLNFGKLEHKLVSLLGFRPKGELEFESSLNLNRPESRSFRQLLWFIVDQLDSIGEKLPPLVLRELEQTVLVAFLSVNHHSFSHLMEQTEGDLAPRHVREVEDYIEANWNRALSIEELHARTDVSVRALFKAFEKHRGYSPMVFAKRVRMAHAKRMLSSDGNASVTGVAFACGFGNLGHFARDYREFVRELPSETLARSRRQAPSLDQMPPESASHRLAEEYSRAVERIGCPVAGRVTT